MERMDEVRLIEALQTIAGAFIDDGMIDDLTRDISRIADALEKIADCIGETYPVPGRHFLRTLDCGRD